MFKQPEKFVKELLNNSFNSVALQVAEEALSYPINAYQELLDCNNGYSYGVSDLFLHGTSIQQMRKYDYVPWIGEVSGVRRPVWDIKSIMDDVPYLLEQDGAYFSGKDKPAPSLVNFIQIFVASDINGYGHVYRQSKDGTWSHKLGVGNWVSGYADVSGKHGLIENPATSFRGEYVIPIGFFQFPVGTQIGIKAFENKMAKIKLGGNLGKYLRETQVMRDHCRLLNRCVAVNERSSMGFYDQFFKEVYIDYLIVKKRFEKVCDSCANEFSRYNLLQVQEIRNQSQFIR